MGYVVTLLVFVCAALPTAAQEVDQAKLRKAARLPKISLLGGVGFNSDTGFFLLGETRDVRPKIAALQKTLKGDATDAATYYRLGDLYDEAKEEKKAKDAYEQAVRLYRQRLKDDPDNGRLLAEFGAALLAVENDEEGETVLRKAARKAPGEATAWLELGRHLESRALYTLIGDPSGKGKHLGLAALLAIVLKGKLAAQFETRAAPIEAEARTCFDRAVAAAPKNPRCYVDRACFHTRFGMMHAAFRASRGEDENLARAMYSEETLADLEQVAELSPDDYRAQGVVALYAVMVAAGKAEDRSPKAILAAMPKKARQDFDKRVARLEKLTASPEREKAAGAEEVLALVCWLGKGDADLMQKHARRAVELNPAREQAWDALTIAAVIGGDAEETLRICQERVKKRDSARARFLLAKSLADKGDFDQAERELRQAVALDGSHYHAQLGLAAVLLRRAEKAAILEEAGKHLDLASRTLDDKASAEERDKHALLKGIHQGLSGERLAARQTLLKILDTDKDNRDAKAALAALGE
jgi:tetratricopeptide (TPR) repeat protein